MRTLISLFAGCGGSSLGYKMAGFKELLAVDWDRNSEETFRLNFPGVPFWNRNVREVKADEILGFCKLKTGELDLLDGSPPCQGFSTAGKRKVFDLRNDLFKEFVRFINGLQPKVFVMENVSGMVKGKMKGRFIEIIKSLKSLNYRVKCKRLNAMYYGVPQSRQRLFFIGVRDDLGKEPVFPKSDKRIITVKEVFMDVQNKNYAKEPKGYKEVYSYILPGKSAIKCVPKKVLKKYVPRMVNNTNYSFQGICRRLKLNGVSHTVLKTIIPYSNNSIIHPVEDRNITIEELKRICSFPDSFKLIGSFENKWARLGNAVMPKQMEAIARAIRKEVFGDADV